MTAFYLKTECSLRFARPHCNLKKRLRQLPLSARTRSLIFSLKDGGHARPRRLEVRQPFSKHSAILTDRRITCSPRDVYMIRKAQTLVSPPHMDLVRSHGAVLKTRRAIPPSVSRPTWPQATRTHRVSAKVRRMERKWFLTSAKPTIFSFRFFLRAPSVQDRKERRRNGGLQWRRHESGLFVQSLRVLRGHPHRAKIHGRTAQTNLDSDDVPPAVDLEAHNRKPGEIFEGQKRDINWNMVLTRKRESFSRTFKNIWDLLQIFLWPICVTIYFKCLGVRQFYLCTTLQLLNAKQFSKQQKNPIYTYLTQIFLYHAYLCHIYCNLSNNIYSESSKL